MARLGHLLLRAPLESSAPTFPLLEQSGGRARKRGRAELTFRDDTENTQ